MITKTKSASESWLVAKSTIPNIWDWPEFWWCQNWFCAPFIALPSLYQSMCLLGTKEMTNCYDIMDNPLKLKSSFLEIVGNEFCSSLSY